MSEKIAGDLFGNLLNSIFKSAGGGVFSAFSANRNADREVKIADAADDHFHNFLRAVAKGAHGGFVADSQDGRASRRTRILRGSFAHYDFQGLPGDDVAEVKGAGAFALGFGGKLHYGGGISAESGGGAAQRNPRTVRNLGGVGRRRMGGRRGEEKYSRETQGQLLAWAGFSGSDFRILPPSSTT